MFQRIEPDPGLRNGEHHLDLGDIHYQVDEVCDLDLADEILALTLKVTVKARPRTSSRKISSPKNF